MRMRSSSSVQLSRLIEGSSWLCQRSRHCFPLRPGRFEAMAAHLCDECHTRSSSLAYVALLPHVHTSRPDSSRAPSPFLCASARRVSRSRQRSHALRAEWLAPTLPGGSVQADQPHHCLILLLAPRPFWYGALRALAVPCRAQGGKISRSHWYGHGFLSARQEAPPALAALAASTARRRTQCAGLAGRERSRRERPEREIRIRAAARRRPPPPTRFDSVPVPVPVAGSEDPRTAQRPNLPPPLGTCRTVLKSGFVSNPPCCLLFVVELLSSSRRSSACWNGSRSDLSAPA